MVEALVGKERSKIRVRGTDGNIIELSISRLSCRNRFARSGNSRLK